MTILPDDVIAMTCIMVGLMATHKKIWWDNESLTQHIITQHLPFQIFIQLT